MKHWDVVVVGLGAVGSAALYGLAARGARVLGLDRFTPPHPWGSSHGETRITREATGEGRELVPLVRRSNALWRELEERSGERLFLRTGLLVLGRRSLDGQVPDGPGGTAPSNSNFVEATREVARLSSVEHLMLSSIDLNRRFPAFAPASDEHAYFEPGAGLLYPERCLSAQLRLARQDGASVHTGETVHRVTPEGPGVRVLSDRSEYLAGRVILSAGPWLADLLPQTAPLLRVQRQVLHWFAPLEPGLYRPDSCPVFIWHHGPGDAHFYGFPLAGEGDGVKLATEQFGASTHPSAVEREVGGEEAGEFWRTHPAGRLRGLHPAALRSQVCLYTSTADAGFLIDSPPGCPELVVASACSGHGFKHSAAVGEAAAQLALGEEPLLPLAPFGWNRRPAYPPAGDRGGRARADEVR